MKTRPWLNPKAQVAFASAIVILLVLGAFSYRSLVLSAESDQWVRHSHEHFDGSGYPAGLAGDAIPLASRILLVADAFDAITSDRPYRSAASQTDALVELRRNGGRQFDPRCVDALEKFVIDSGFSLEDEDAGAGAEAVA